MSCILVIGLDHQWDPKHKWVATYSEIYELQKPASLEYTLTHLIINLLIILILL